MMKTNKKARKKGSYKSKASGLKRVKEKSNKALFENRNAKPLEYGEIVISDDALVSRDGYSKDRKFATSYKNSKKIGLSKILSKHENDPIQQQKEDEGIYMPIKGGKYKSIPNDSYVDCQIYTKTGKDRHIKESLLLKTGDIFDSDDRERLKKHVLPDEKENISKSKIKIIKRNRVAIK